MRFNCEKVKLRPSNKAGSFVLAFGIGLAVAVMSMSYYYSNYIFIRSVDNNRLLYIGAFKALHDSVLNSFYSQKAFVNSAKSTLNADLDRCLRDATYMCPSGTRPLHWFLDNSDTTAWLPMNSNDGLTVNLQACTSYPSFRCPFKYNLQWTTECDYGASSCVLPSVVFSGELQLLSDIRKIGLINSNRFDFYLRIR